MLFMIGADARPARAGWVSGCSSSLAHAIRRRSGAYFISGRAISALASSSRANCRATVSVGVFQMDESPPTAA
jgi:hypothetical protein